MKCSGYYRCKTSGYSSTANLNLNNLLVQLEGGIWFNLSTGRRNLFVDFKGPQEHSLEEVELDYDTLKYFKRNCPHIKKWLTSRYKKVRDFAIKVYNLKG